MDLYVVSGGNEFPPDSDLLQDRLYLNDGQGKFTRSSNRLPDMKSSGSCVVPGDFDKDGDQDLFVGGRVVPGKYPFPARSWLLRNNNGVFTDVTSKLAPELTQPCLVTSAVWTDFDEDGLPDLIVVGEWMPVTFFRNTGDKFKDKTRDYGMNNTTGWWNKIVAADFDGDGDDDYVIGNLGLNYKYKATKNEPFEIYCDDFDKNGFFDIVLGYHNYGNCFPVRGRQCSSEQMPFIKKEFHSYEEFGRATLIQIYGNKLRSSLHYKTVNFASSYLENNGGGVFTLHNLPNEIQFAPVNGISVKDVNSDGKLDILMAGNLYVSEVETGRADAGIGICLIGDGGGTFQSHTPPQERIFC